MLAIGLRNIKSLKNSKHYPNELIAHLAKHRQRMNLTEYSMCRKNGVILVSSPVKRENGDIE